jgi:hypothetical protein
MRSTRLAFPLVLGLALSIAASARAGTYSSPFLRTPSVSYALDCVVSNVGSTPLTLTVTLYDGFGGVISPDFDACNPNTQEPVQCTSSAPPAVASSRWGRARFARY